MHWLLHDCSLQTMHNHAGPFFVHFVYFFATAFSKSFFCTTFAMGCSYLKARCFVLFCFVQRVFPKKQKSAALSK